MNSLASSWSDESNGGIDKKWKNSSSVFLEKKYERSSGSSMNNLSSPLSNDGLAFVESYDWSTMGAPVDEDTHTESWMTGSPRKLGRNGGGLDGGESSLVECWCSSSHSYSPWMIAHVRCVTPTASMGCSLFKTSKEYRMDENKTTSPEEHLSGKTEVEKNNAYGNSKDSQSTLLKNWVERCWKGGRGKKCANVILGITRR